MIGASSFENFVLIIVIANVQAEIVAADHVGDEFPIFL